MSLEPDAALPRSRVATTPRSRYNVMPGAQTLSPQPPPNIEAPIRRSMPPSLAADALTTNPISPLNHRFGALVTEIAARTEPLATVLIKHGVTKKQWLQLKELPAFKAALERQHKAFGSIDDLPTRIKLKAQLLTEALLDEMFDIARHIAYPASARVSAFAQIKNLTGLEKPEDAAPQRAFNLTINLAGGKSKTAQAVTLEAVAERDAIATDERYLLAGSSEEADNGERDSGLAGDNLDTDVFSAGDQVLNGLVSDLSREAADEEDPKPVFDRTWNSFKRVSSGPALSNHPGPAVFEPDKPFAGAAGGNSDTVKEKSDTVGIILHQPVSETGSAARPTPSLRERLSALDTIKSSNNQ